MGISLLGRAVVNIVVKQCMHSMISFLELVRHCHTCSQASKKEKHCFHLNTVNTRWDVPWCIMVCHVSRWWYGFSVLDMKSLAQGNDSLSFPTFAQGLVASSGLFSRELKRRRFMLVPYSVALLQVFWEWEGRQHNWLPGNFWEGKMTWFWTATCHITRLHKLATKQNK